MVEISLNPKGSSMGLKVNTIQAKNFETTQVLLIQDTLNEITFEGGCIPKRILFECVQEHEPEMFQMELYEFEMLLTQAIRSNAICGFEIRQGRGGGICEAGAFDEKDSKKKGKLPSVTFNGKTFKITPSKKKILSFIIQSSSQGENGEGNLFINNKLYSVPEKIDTLEFLEEYLNLGK